MKKIKINIRMDEDKTPLPGLGESLLELPEYKTHESAGCDLLCNEKEAVKLFPLDRAFIHTGVFIALPEGYMASVRGRSGLNKWHGIIVPTGTIDSDYRGEIGVIVYNLSREPFTIYPGDRIAQLIIHPVIQADWQQVAYLDKTDRGEGGFGSTGR